MTNFKWCVWLVPGEGHEWNSLTNGFPAHMTVKSHLERDEAEKLVKEIDFKPVFVRMFDEQIPEVKDGFNCLYFKVDRECDWFPENPHISFRYSYGSNFYPELYNDEIYPWQALLERIVIVDCSDHFTKWKID